LLAKIIVVVVEEKLSFVRKVCSYIAFLVVFTNTIYFASTDEVVIVCYFLENYKINY